VERNWRFCTKVRASSACTLAAGDVVERNWRFLAERHRPCEVAIAAGDVVERNWRFNGHVGNLRISPRRG
jgi:hypothetical protein